MNAEALSSRSGSGKSFFVRSKFSVWRIIFDVNRNGWGYSIERNPCESQRHPWPSPTSLPAFSIATFLQFFAAMFMISFLLHYTRVPLGHFLWRASRAPFAVVVFSSITFAEQFSRQQHDKSIHNKFVFNACSCASIAKFGVLRESEHDGRTSSLPSFGPFANKLFMPIRIKCIKDKLLATLDFAAAYMSTGHWQCCKQAHKHIMHNVNDSPVDTACVRRTYADARRIDIRLGPFPLCSRNDFAHLRSIRIDSFAPSPMTGGDNHIPIISVIVAWQRHARWKNTPHHCHPQIIICNSIQMFDYYWT